MRTVRRWVADTAGGLPGTYWVLWFSLLISRVGTFVIILLAIYLTQQRGLSPAFAGFVLGLWGAGGAIGTLAGGVLADRWGRRATLLTALYSSAAMMLLLSAARSKGEIAVAVLLLGVASEAVRPAMNALTIDVVAEADRLRAFSLTFWVINAGFAVAALTAGFVANVSYPLLFVLDAATTAAGATLVAVKVREPRRAAPTARTLPRPGSGRPGSGRAGSGRAGSGRAGSGREPGLRAVFADKVFLGFVGVNVLTAMVFMQHMSTLPMAMSRDGLPPATFGTVIALNGVLIVVGQLFMARLLAGLRRASALAVASLVVGVGFGLNALADTALLYAVAVLVWTVGEMLHAPSTSTLNAELSPAGMRGRYQGVFSLSWSVAAFVAPITGSAVLQYAGEATLWLGCFAVSVVVAAVHVLAGPARERRAVALRTAPHPGADHDPQVMIEADRRPPPHDHGDLEKVARLTVSEPRGTVTLRVGGSRRSVRRGNVRGSRRSR